MSGMSAMRGRRRETPLARRPQRTGIRTAAVALLCALSAIGVSQVLRTLHLALEPHTRCIHGEFVHVEGHHHGGHDRAESPPSLDDRSELRDSEARSSRHQHCDATAVPQAPLPTVLAEIAPQLLTWLSPAPRLGPADARGGIELLALAPKLSPPQA